MSGFDLASFPLRPARVHEVCGPGATAFAVMSAASCPQRRAGGGTVLWISERRQGQAVNPAGLAPFLDPSKLLLAVTEGQTDTLAVAEEALRDGVLPFVIIAITRPLDLREGRRLQLAAKTGGATGLCLIPEGMGSNAAETRWRAAPVFDSTDADSTLARWEIIKNKSGTFGAWHVQWNRETDHLHVVSPVVQRPDPQAAPG